MEVISCGVEVVLKRSEYHGVITCINIRDSRITYEVSYYEAGVYKSNLFCDYEFYISAEQEKMPIGFRSI